jgi:hypothetical protein
MLVFLPRDRRSNASPLQVLTIFSKRIPFVACDPLRTDAQVTIAAPDRALFQKPLRHRDLVLLTGSEEKRDRFAFPITTYMDLR